MCLCMCVTLCVCDTVCVSAYKVNDITYVNGVFDHGRVCLDPERFEVDLDHSSQLLDVNLTAVVRIELLEDLRKRFHVTHLRSSSGVLCPTAKPVSQRASRQPSMASNS